MPPRAAARSPWRRGAAAIFAAALAAAACSGTGEPAAGQDPGSGCAPGRILDFGFYAYFAPVSYSADGDPDSPGFGKHTGYEADLLDALEAMDGAGLQFRRIPVADWPGIWLLPATGDVDIAGGGITILESRTRDAEGNSAVAFTSGHMTFRQSLLVRADEASLYPSHDDLRSDTIVGAITDTTGEQRLLELTGLSGAGGALAPGTEIHTPEGTLVADGTDAYVITAAGSSHNLQDRTGLVPPSPQQPYVLYRHEEDELIEALASGEMDAVARGAIGNIEVAATYGGGGVFAVTALDDAVEKGGWTVRASETELRACIDDKLGYLTDDLRIDYPQWHEDNEVFMERALAWSP